MWLALLVMSAGILCLLRLVTAGPERQWRRDWERLLTSRGDRVFRGPVAWVRFEIAFAEITRPESYAAIEFGSLDDAKRLADAGYEVIAKFAPTLRTLLIALAVFAPLVTTTPFSSRAGHRTARLHLRLYMLGRGCALVCLHVRASIRRTQRSFRPTASSQALWQLAERREQWRPAPETRTIALWTALIAVALVASVLLRQL